MITAANDVPRARQSWPINAAFRAKSVRLLRTGPLSAVTTITQMRYRHDSDVTGPSRVGRRRTRADDRRALYIDPSVGPVGLSCPRGHEPRDIHLSSSLPRWCRCQTQISGQFGTSNSYHSISCHIHQCLAILLANNFPTQGQIWQRLPVSDTVSPLVPGSMLLVTEPSLVVRPAAVSETPAP